jgi:hypothetical protein
MTPYITDREKQVILAALDAQRESVQAYLFDKSPVKQNYKPRNSYDILAPEHTLMHTLTLMAKLTNQPIAHFTNPHPSQQPEPKTHS